MAEPFKLRRTKGGKKYACYYGKIRVGQGEQTTWKRVKLCTDRKAAREMLRNLQAVEDQRAVGLITPDMDRLARPLSELIDDYFAHLKNRNGRPESIRVCRWMTDRLVELGGWRYFRDITADSMEAIIRKLRAEDATVSYINKFIARAKALVHYLLPAGAPSPLAKVRRLSERGAKRTRARRAATATELASLFSLKMPEDRRIAYALAAYNGLRRNEAAGLRWERVHLNAPIPFVELPQKQGTDDTLDSIPLHPYVVGLLREKLAGFPSVRVIRHVPDVKTVEKDWGRAGVAFSDASGRRLDYHALRHTFSSRLDLTGCSRGTKKRLMRHAAEDVTDGYTHAELAESLVALVRLPSPEPAPQQARKTGTDDAPAADQIADQAATSQCLSSPPIQQTGSMPAAEAMALKKAGFSRKCLTGLKIGSDQLSRESRYAIIPCSGRRTQVD